MHNSCTAAMEGFQDGGDAGVSEYEMTNYHQPIIHPGTFDMTEPAGTKLVQSFKV